MSGYIMDLRKLVGHRTLIQCAGSIIVQNDQGEILLGRRTDNGLWGYSGGSVQIDERVEDCAIRELKQQFGLTALSLSFFMVNSGPAVHYVYPNGDEVSNIEIIYTCNRWQGSPVFQQEEMSELCWVKPADIDLRLISPPIRPVVAAYIKSHT